MLGRGYLPWTVEWCRTSASTAAVPQPATAIDAKASTSAGDAGTADNSTFGPGTNTGTPGASGTSTCERRPD